MDTTTTKRGSKGKVTDITSKKSGNGKEKSNGADADFDAGAENKNIRKSKAVEQDLPGMEDRKIKPLHDKALEYVGYRNERQSVLAKEVEAKGQLLDLMHAHKKEIYICEGIEVSIVRENEKIKVKVAKGDDEDDDDV